MKATTADQNQGPLIPVRLRAGDRVRFVSPASTPDKESMMRCVDILQSWGLDVDVADHAFDRFGYLAGRDEHRIEDLNTAFADPTVRALFATRGGKGAYRIADKLDFDIIGKNPKWLVGFSDISILHLALWKHCKLVGVHGALYGIGDNIAAETIEGLRSALMDTATITLRSDNTDPTAALTTTGHASGVLLGGNLDMISTAAGWVLPSLKNVILLIEAVNMGLGQVDRQLTMLANAGHLHGLKGVAVGQFSGFKAQGGWTIIDLLRDHLERLDIPILGGLALGHGHCPRTALLGTTAHLETSTQTLTITPGGD